MWGMHLSCVPNRAGWWTLNACVHELLGDVVKNTAPRPYPHPWLCPQRSRLTRSALDPKMLIDLIQMYGGPQMHFEIAGIVVEEVHANLLAGLMKLSGREDRNKKHRRSMFTFIMSYKYPCSSLVFSCYG